MTIELNLTETALRERRNVKWSRYGTEVVPAWIAEMDYAAAPPVQAIIDRIARQQDYGYAARGGKEPVEALAEAFAARMGTLYGWHPHPKAIQFISAFDQGILAALMAFTEAGDGIIVQTPCYPPFYEVMREGGRRFIKNPMRPGTDGYEIDLVHLDQVAAKARVLLLCNPQNPTGRVFTRSELQAIADIAIRHDLIVIADEIHSEIVYDPFAHIPLATLGPEIAARTITLNSASKSFNIPGLYCGVMCFGTPELAARYHAKLPAMLMGQVNTFGVDATLAAWAEGNAWAGAVKTMLTARRAQVVATVRDRLPQLTLYQPQGTYLAWLDMTALGLKKPAAAFLLEQGKVACMPGEWFSPEAKAFVRLNFATSEPILTKILDRIEAAVRSL